jgi:dolichol-phosphate mannosyltransferase
MADKIFIGLPAFNEEKSLPELLSKIIDFSNNIDEELEVIVVDDGSTDRTKKIIEAFSDSYHFIKGLYHEKNLGLGAAINTIFHAVIEKACDNDFLVTMDADNTHNPYQIINMIQRIKEENLDLIIASRFVRGGEERGVPLIRRLYSRGAKYFFKLFFNIRNINDYSSGFRVYKVGYLRRSMQLYNNQLITTNGFDCMAEILAKFSKIGIKAAEYPLKLQYDLKASASKMKVFETILGYFDLLRRVKKPH